MNEEQLLRERLAEIDVPPTRIQVETLVRDGRQRVVRRRWGQAAAGALVTAGVLVAVPSLLPHSDAAPVVVTQPSPSPSVSAVLASCATTTLRVPKGLKKVAVTAIDPSGRYIVGNGTAGQDFRPIRWTDGKPEALPLSGESVQLTAVNSSGVVVGLISEGDRDFPFRFENGKYTRLTMPRGAWNPYPYPAINDRGDIVINLEPLGNTGGKDAFPVVWPAGSSTATRVPLPKGASVHGIADDGTLIGTVYKNGSATQPYAWDQQGNGKKLRLPPGFVGAAYYVRGDWVTGGLWKGGDPIPGRWNRRTGEVSVLDSGGTGGGSNSLGWVATAEGALFRPDATRAQLDAPAGEEGAAVAISDTGLVAGNSVVSATGAASPHTWRC